MAGVGPFAVPLTTTKNNTKNKNIIVYANDLNPASYMYLQKNATRNKCQNLHCYNMDARAFVQKLQDERIHVDHVIMNLPKTAPEFLDAFQNYAAIDHTTKPTNMHVYCFAPKDSQDAGYPEAIQRCEAALSRPIPRDTVRVRTIRNIAPSKNMVCVTFVLPTTRKESEDKECEEKDPKRVKSCPDG